MNENTVETVGLMKHFNPGMTPRSTYSALTGEKVVKQTQLQDNFFMATSMNDYNSVAMTTVPHRTHPAAVASPSVTYSSRHFSLGAENYSNLTMPSQESVPLVYPTFCRHKDFLPLSMAHQQNGTSNVTMNATLSRSTSNELLHGQRAFSGIDLSCGTNLGAACTPSPPRRGSQSIATTNISAHDLRKLFHLPLIDAAKTMGIGVTVFKTVCRRNNISKWPFRGIQSKLKKIQESVKYLADGGHHLPEYLKSLHVNKISDMKKEIEVIKENAVRKFDTNLNFESSTSNSGTDDGETSGPDGDSSSDNGKNSVYSEGIDENKASHKRNRSRSDDNASHAEPQHYKKKKFHEYLLTERLTSNCANCGKAGKYRGLIDSRPLQDCCNCEEQYEYFRDATR